MKYSSVFQRAASLVALAIASAAPASAQSAARGLEGMWSDPPVTGNSTHTNTSSMFFRKLVRADGSELLPGAAQRESAIEQERRERAKARQAK